MTAKRGATHLAGLLVIDKPAGMTSHAVVEAVRRATGERRVGHAGTLDPLATGVLLVLVGPYTRLERYLSGKTKSYDAVIAFGAETDTDDADGTTTRTASVPPELLDPDTAVTLLGRFVGDSMQQPPIYSAIKVAGKTAHRVARSGGEIELAPRPITVFEAELVGIDPGEATWTVHFTVSKGTYIRALARDIGRAGCSAAHVRSLRRTASGAVTAEETITLARLAEANNVRTLFADPIPALAMPVLEVDDAQAYAVANGRPFAVDDLADGAVALTFHERLIAVYQSQGGRLIAETVLGVQR
ncbi:MAG: tRNA pseudouridine(55) synthase TruB [Coriobacteriia bacterium]|nr:tRNA pseudouridine(55) synthase TruB [Coriobacteriia bacterium]